MFHCEGCTVHKVTLSCTHLSSSSIQFIAFVSNTCSAIKATTLLPLEHAPPFYTHPYADEFTFLSSMKFMSVRPQIYNTFSDMCYTGNTLKIASCIYSRSKSSTMERPIINSMTSQNYKVKLPYDQMLMATYIKA